MANSFSASFRDVWAREQQEVFYKTNVAKQIADTSFNNTLTNGDVLVRTYRSSTGYPAVYVRGTDMTERTLTDTAETLTVNSEYYDFFYVDDHDKMQNNYNAALGYGKDGGMMLSNQIDADVLGEVFNATSTVDGGNVTGGTTGLGIALTTTTILEAVTVATQKLKKLNVMSGDRYAVVSPEWENIMVRYGAARATDLGDDINRSPDFKSWLGYDFYVSNQLAGSAVLSLATQPTANDPITIAGVTFTFVSSIGTTAGNVLIGANVDATRANLETLINAPGTTTSTGVALSADNVKFFASRISAVNSNSADTLTVKAKGIGVLVVTETLTDATDTWTATKIKQHQLFGVRGNPCLVMQIEPNIQFVKAEKRNGYFYQNTILYGKKTFADNAKQMVNVEVAASSYTA